MHSTLFRFSGVGFAALFAKTVGADHTDAGAVTAKFPIGKINGACITLIRFSKILGLMDLKAAGRYFTTPTTVITPLWQGAVASRARFFSERFSAMGAFQGKSLHVSGRLYRWLSESQSFFGNEARTDLSRQVSNTSI